MIKTVLSFLFIFANILASSAQNFRIDNLYASQQGGTTDEIAPPTTLRNLTRQPIVLHWEITKKNIPDGWSFMVNDRYVTDKGILTLAGSETFEDFKVNFRPNGFMGIGSIEITVFEPNQRAATEETVTFTASASVFPSAGSLASDVPQVFPNPATDFISVSSASTPVRRIEIFNIVGKKVMDFSANNDAEKYDVSSLPRGMYLIRLIDQSGNIIRTQRISKYNP